MMSNWNGHGWWGMGVGFVFLILLGLLVTLGVAALIRWLQKPARQEPATYGKTPLEIVQERYARGEIDREEYLQKIQDLEQRP